MASHFSSGGMVQFGLTSCAHRVLVYTANRNDTMMRRIELPPQADFERTGFAASIVLHNASGSKRETQSVVCLSCLISPVVALRDGLSNASACPKLGLDRKSPARLKPAP